MYIVSVHVHPTEIVYQLMLYRVLTCNGLVSYPGEVNFILLAPQEPEISTGPYKPSWLAKEFNFQHEGITICITCFQCIFWFCYLFNLQKRKCFSINRNHVFPTSGLNKDTLRKNFLKQLDKIVCLERIEDQQKHSTYSIGQEIKWKWFHTIFQGKTLINVNCLSMIRLSSRW